ncbi:hypothetical protein RBSWK_05610 [Rhodopirellula baltica SWK14]|uniref:Uncharacterized protein n=1 Tax=Rhodopirellula baltica SWK14 TaxID=993516 RepID=L7C9J4_RHOBT|nr:hypothetical protein RBSWK_05610 [Rhodopirellula baltica SWK14]
MAPLARGLRRRALNDFDNAMLPQSTLTMVGAMIGFVGCNENRG